MTMAYLNARPIVQEWTPAKQLAASGVQMNYTHGVYDRDGAHDEMMAHALTAATRPDCANSTNLICVILRGQWIATLYTEAAR